MDPLANVVAQRPVTLHRAKNVTLLIRSVTSVTDRPIRPTSRRRVAFTIGRSVCFCEKCSIRSAKSPRYSPHRTATCADLKSGLEHTSLQSPFLVRRASGKPFRRYAFPGCTTKLQSRQSMRQTLVEGRSDAANARVVHHWYRIQASCLASLQTRAILSTCSCADGADRVHVLIVCSLSPFVGQ